MLSIFDVKNVSLFICNSFVPKEEGGQFEQLIAFENETLGPVMQNNEMLGPVMQNKSRKKSKRIRGKGSRAGAKAKLQQKS